MSLYYSVKHRIKVMRWRMRRARVSLRYGAENLESAPIVLGNSIPKAGSHLIIQVLHSLTKLGPFVDTGFFPVNRWEDNRKLPPEDVLRNIEAMQPGDIGYGYVHCHEPFLSALTGPERATVFIYRDPRDVVVSAMNYATYMNVRHGLHGYFNERLASDEERIDAVIRGIPETGIEYSSIRTRYDHYVGWLEQPEVLSLRFEDLTLDRDSTLHRLLNYLKIRGFKPSVSDEEAVAVMKAGIEPKKSGTFRKGQPGGWRKAFTEANKEAFKQTAGDLLIRLGYESDQDW
jgi:hypothetical protein